MHKTLIAVITLVFLIACAPAEQQITEPAEVKPPKLVEAKEPEPVKEQQEKPAEKTVPEPEPEIEGQYEPSTQEKPSIQKFASTFLNEVKNYKFKHDNNWYKVKGDLVRIELGRVLKNAYNAPFIDVVYLDRERRMATGVCEGLDNNIKKQCALRGTLKQRYAVPYLKFAIKFPDDWLEEFQNLYTVQAQTPQLVTDRPTIHLKHATQLRTTDLYFDPTSGLPIAVIDNNKEYHYTKLSKNTVTETFLVEQK